MMKQLIVKLREPTESQRYWVDLFSDPLRITTDGYDDSWVSGFNAALLGISDGCEGARFSRSFPAYSRLLREEKGGFDSDLSLFFRLWNLAGGQLASAVKILGDKRLKMVEEVREAEPMIPASLDYLKPGTSVGVDAEFTQKTGLPGSGGEYVQICVVDLAYQVCHPDLPQDPQKITLVQNTATGSDESHGTRCLGVLVGQGSTLRGIVHGLKKCWFAASGGTQAFTLAEDQEFPPVGVLNALDQAMFGQGVLEPGDVMLIPKQTNLQKPVEVNSDVLGCCRELYDKGIIVVEAAGNKGDDVAILNPPDGPDDDSYKDAIMVGGGDPDITAPGFMMPVNSNYGARVDCQGWGRNITTTDADPGCNPMLPEDSCGFAKTSAFGASSGASSIVAGVVAVVQSVHKAAEKGVIEPSKMREALKTTGKPQPQTTQGLSQHLGPLPDIRELLWHFELLPNIYLREDKDDKGEAVVGAAQSPFEALDIIPRRQEESNLDDAFVDNGKWDLGLGRDLIRGDSSWIYLRVQNGGPFEDEPTIRLYWAEPGAVSSPSDWEQIDSEVLVSLGPGDQKVVGGLKWKKTPAVDELCLIAVVQSKFHDTPGFANPSLGAGDLIFLHEHRKITYRSVTTKKKPCSCFLF